MEEDTISNKWSCSKTKICQGGVQFCQMAWCYIARFKSETQLVKPTYVSVWTYPGLCKCSVALVTNMKWRGTQYDFELSDIESLICVQWLGLNHIWRIQWYPFRLLLSRDGLCQDSLGYRWPRLQAAGMRAETVQVKYLWASHTLCHVWRMPNSVSVGFGPAIWTGS